MIYPVTITAMFQSIGLVYGLSLPLIMLGIFTLLTLPALLRQTGKVESIVHASYCYLAQMLGILLMTAGALPALYAVFAMQALSALTYIGLVVVFAVGGIIFLWHDNQLKKVDSASRAIPASLFVHAWRFVGLVIVVFSGLSLALRLMLQNEQQENWWITHMIMLLYGLLVLWFSLKQSNEPKAVSVVARPAPVARKAAPKAKK